MAHKAFRHETCNSFFFFITLFARVLKIGSDLIAIDLKRRKGHSIWPEKRDCTSETSIRMIPAALNLQIVTEQRVAMETGMCDG